MRALRLLLATLLLAAGLTLPLLATAPAAAEEPDALVSVRLDSFEPSLPQRRSEITLTGRVTNTSKKRLFRPRAYFWRNQAPITDTEGFDQALDSASNDPIGRRYIPSFDNLFDDDDPYLAAGASAEFTLRVKVSDLELSPTSGLYLMGVHVLQNEEATAVGRARIFVPVLSKPPRNNQQMTTVVILNSRPSLVSKGVFADDHLAHEIAPGGRLDELLGAADQTDVSFAVDPALIEEVETMRSGYRALEGGGDEDSGKAAAERWLTGYTRMAAARDGYRLPYGSPDVAALAHAGRQDILVGATAAARTVASTASLPLLVWPGSGAADAPTLAAAESLRPAAVLLSDKSTRAGAPLLQGVPMAGQNTTRIVNYTSAAFAGGPGPKPSDTAVHLQQRSLAESWLQAATEPAGTTLGRVRVISTRAQAESDDESVKAPWIRQTTLSQLLRSAPSKWSQVLHYSTANRGKELSGAQLNSLDELTTGWATWQDLLVDKTAARAGANAALARTASVRFRGATTTFDSFVTPQQNDLGARLNAVEISASRRLSITPKSRVSFPITIRNTLEPSTDPAAETFNEIKVELRFESANSQRLTVQPIGLESIPAGQNFQANALVEASTNGTVRVTARLYTASGLPVGRPRTIDVKATQAGTVGWIIAIGAGIVLAGTTALRIRQVTRSRARAAASDPPPSTDATRSAPPQDIPVPQGATPDAATPDSRPADPAPTSPDLRGAPGQNTSESIDV